MTENFIQSLGNKVYICGDIGSTHGGKLDNAIDAISIAVDLGFNCLKFQLGVSDPNIDFSFDKFIKAFEWGKKLNIDITASIFDPMLLEKYLELEPRFIKFAYSQKDCVEDQDTSTYSLIPVVVSCDIMTYKVPRRDTVKLFCLPSYPVYYEINFDEIFNRFHGFSDHSLGYRQTLKAVENGSLWIEKHVNFNKKTVDCPDAKFALNINQAKDMIEKIRNLDLDWKRM